MKRLFSAICLTAIAALFAAPAAPALADGFYRHHHGDGLVFGVVGAAAGAAAAIVTAPVRLAEAVVDPYPAYYRAPVYYQAPPPVYAYPQPVYYSRPYYSRAYYAPYYGY